MEIILLILKIILIVFLAIIGLILLALGIVLFVPVHYEVSGEVGDSWSVRICGKVKYLLSAVKFLFSYENEEFNTKLFLFGFEKKPQQDVASGDEAQHDDDDIEITFHDKTTHSMPAEESESVQVFSEKCNVQDVSMQPSQKHTAESEPEKKIDSVKKTNEKQTKKPQKEKEQNKIDFSFIKQQLTDEQNKSVVRKIWSELCYLFRHFKFRKIKTDMMFATGDPAITGQILGILCMIPLLYRYEFKLVPDFEADEPYIKGTFLIAGRIRLIHVLLTVLRLILDKEVRIVFKRVLKILGQ